MKVASLSTAYEYVSEYMKQKGVAEYTFTNDETSQWGHERHGDIHYQLSGDIEDNSCPRLEANKIGDHPSDRNFTIFEIYVPADKSLFLSLMSQLDYLPEFE